VVLLRPLLLRRVVLRFVLAPAAQSSLIDASRACAEQWVQQQRKASRQNGACQSAVTERVSQCESLSEAQQRSAVETNSGEERSTGSANVLFASNASACTAGSSAATVAPLRMLYAVLCAFSVCC